MLTWPPMSKNACLYRSFICTLSCITGEHARWTCFCTGLSSQIQDMLLLGKQSLSCHVLSFWVHCMVQSAYPFGQRGWGIQDIRYEVKSSRQKLWSLDVVSLSYFWPIRISMCVFPSLQHVFWASCGVRGGWYVFWKRVSLNLVL